jgi:hypothetical protein
MSDRPAHVLGDVVGEIDLLGEKHYHVAIAGIMGERVVVTVPSQYVLVGDPLDALYTEGIEDYLATLDFDNEEIPA